MPVIFTAAARVTTLRHVWAWVAWLLVLAGCASTGGGAPMTPLEGREWFVELRYTPSESL